MAILTVLVRLAHIRVQPRLAVDDARVAVLAEAI